MTCEKFPPLMEYLESSCKFFLYAYVEDYYWQLLYLNLKYAHFCCHCSVSCQYGDKVKDKSGAHTFRLESAR